MYGRGLCNFACILLHVTNKGLVHSFILLDSIGHTFIKIRDVEMQEGKNIYTTLPPAACDWILQSCDLSYRTWEVKAILMTTMIKK